MSEVEERIGTVIGGKYRIDSLIQKGGMSYVYAATHMDSGIKVAVKLFLSYLADEEKLVSRFLNEAAETSKLRHRNIVDVLDVGKDESGVPFFIMEYLRGHTLWVKLERGAKRMTIKESADIMIQILGGLKEAHSRGITHRDLKPGNIFIAKEPGGSEVVKILDFGVARFHKLERDGKGKLTTTGTILGTPEYMSIEQARARRDEVDHRSDIYSCGVILYRCLTGIHPFKGESQYETIRNIYKKIVPVPSSVRDDLPVEVDYVVMKALHRNKGRRYQDCQSFIDALQVFFEVERIQRDPGREITFPTLPQGLVDPSKKR